MDWLVDRADAEGTTAVLDLVTDHLRRHAADQGEARPAMQSLRDALDTMPTDGWVRIRLDWWTRRPQVALRAVPDPTALGKAARPGVTLTPRHRSSLEAASSPDGPDLVLPVERVVRDTFDGGPPPMPPLRVDL
ncbi:MAG: hypothetical protein HOQ45_07755, partial [Nocardioidaceae bacterium]|nr:hypothetical protein [Nocardioidaceae bacterium]